MFLDKDDSYEHSMFGNKTEFQEIESTSIQTIIDENNLKECNIKLDCEGAEYEILYSLSKRELKKIKFLVLEYHDFDNKPKRNPEALTKLLRRMGFAAQIVPTAIM